MRVESRLFAEVQRTTLRTKSCSEDYLSRPFKIVREIDSPAQVHLQAYSGWLSASVVV
jgi:hypothetical protein